MWDSMNPVEQTFSDRKHFPDTLKEFAILRTFELEHIRTYGRRFQQRVSSRSARGVCKSPLIGVPKVSQSRSCATSIFLTFKVQEKTICMINLIGYHHERSNFFITPMETSTYILRGFEVNTSYYTSWKRKELALDELHKIRRSRIAYYHFTWSTY